VDVSRTESPLGIGLARGASTRFEDINVRWKVGRCDVPGPSAWRETAWEMFPPIRAAAPPMRWPMSAGADRRSPRGCGVTSVRQMFLGLSQSPLIPPTTLVTVVRSPGSGKSTLVAALAGDVGTPVFRLRETIRAHPELLAGLPASTDPLGWIGRAAVCQILDLTLTENRFGFRCSATLLDNVLGTVGQLTLLANTTEATAVRVVLLEPRADARTVAARVVQGRVCPRCFLAGLGRGPPERPGISGSRQLRNPL